MLWHCGPAASVLPSQLVDMRHVRREDAGWARLGPRLRRDRDVPVAINVYAWQTFTRIQWMTRMYTRIGTDERQLKEAGEGAVKTTQVATMEYRVIVSLNIYKSEATV